MYGAILGDIIGSPYEGNRGEKTKCFELFSSKSRFTDDTVMTVAIVEALLRIGEDVSEQNVKEAVTKTMRAWGKRYPYAGYGRGFRKWIFSEVPHPYNSYGNGSAMRVSGVGWMYSTIERTRKVARYTAEVTHNHPEGIKGAEAISSCIYLARTGASKGEIRKYVEDNFLYDLSRSLEQIRPNYYMDVTCQGSVPEAIISFLEATGYEDAIRNAVSLGGDTDTLAAMTGGIAEAFYDLPEHLKSECQNRIGKEMRMVIERFEQQVIKRK